MTLSDTCRRTLLTLSAALLIYIGSSAQSGRRIREHEVQREETVYSIARRYGVAIDKLYELNPWARQQIKVGDKLLIPSTPATSSATPTKGKKHRVANGETLYGISRTYGIDLADLLRANPGLTSSSVQVGMELIIPAAKDDSTTSVAPTKSEENDSSQPSQVAQAQTRILMLLPLKKDKHFVEFYEGFLLGMYQLKKAGISMHLTTLDVPNDEAMDAYIEAGSLRGKDLVIGGVTEGQIRAIAAASGYNYYIIPFSKTHKLESGDGRVVLTNAHTSTIIDRVIPAFLQKYKGREVIFASRPGDSEDGFVTQLRSELSHAGLPFRSIQVGSGLVGGLTADAVIVPISPDRNLALATMAAIGNRAGGITLFGHPQWQAYGSQFQQQLRRYNTTIYTTFFFDPTLPESKAFLSQFTGWFSHKVSNSYPKYSVLGYDLARYFIRAYSMYGRSFISSMSSIPSDGLQLDFYLQRGEGTNVYTNTRFFFVHYPNTGVITREAH